MKPTIYLTRTGLLEPLGQSQVLAYACGLADDHAITILSFERDEDLKRVEDVARIEAICDAHGIRWLPFQYRQKPRVLASLLNLVTLIRVAGRIARENKAQLIHARSYIPAVAAWIVGRRRGIPYIFDMRSLWPEELITAGRLRRGSLLHRLIFWAEGRLLRNAAAVVSLTRAGADYLDVAHPGSLSRDRLNIIPTCTDLDRFRPADAPHAGSPVIGCHGSLASGWFRIDLLAALFSRIAARLPAARFEIITREDPGSVVAALQETGKLSSDVSARLSVTASPANEIHARIQAQNLSMFFYASGAASELGRSPTRMGEALGCGVPILANVGVGDVAEIVRQYGVGYLLEGEDEVSLDQAADAAVDLIADPLVAQRCRAAAEAVYSLSSGVAAYRQIYARLVAKKAASASDL